MNTLLRWACLFLSLAACTSKPRQPDVLLVVMDSVRADRLHAYGYRRPTSRQLDAISDAGVLFEDVTADGTWSWPSHASLFTGEPPWVHGAHHSLSETKGAKLEVSPMREDLPTLAERFGAAGYQTVVLSANSLLDPSLGLTRGFDRAEVMGLDHEVIAAAQELIAAKTEEPLFLVVNLMSAHHPFTVAPDVPWSVSHRKWFQKMTTPRWAAPYLLDQRPPSLAMQKRARRRGLSGEEAYAKGKMSLREEDLAFMGDLYDGELVQVDKALSSLMSSWTASSRAGGVVAITSDHGEYLGEHGQIGHGLTVFREVTHVPMVILAPGQLKPGTRVSSPVQLSDLHDTLLDLSGVEPAAEGSLRPVIKGHPREGPILSAAWPKKAMADRVGGRFALGHRLYRQGHHALMIDTNGNASLFDLQQDPQMLKDRSAADPERLQAMRTAATTAFPQSASGPSIQIPDESMRQLEAVGHLQ